MQIADYLANVTGKSIPQLLWGNPPLAAFSQSAGVVTITHWDASLPAQPTAAQLAAALTATPPLGILQAQLTQQASAVAAQITNAVSPDATHQNAYHIIAAILLANGGTAPASGANATFLVNYATSVGQTEAQLVTAVNAGTAAALNLSAAFETVKAATIAAITATALATALAAFETSITSIVAALNAAGVTVVRPAAISIVGVNA